MGRKTIIEEKKLGKEIMDRHYAGEDITKIHQDLVDRGISISYLTVWHYVDAHKTMTVEQIVRENLRERESRESVVRFQILEERLGKLLDEAEVILADIKREGGTAFEKMKAIETILKVLREIKDLLGLTSPKVKVEIDATVIAEKRVMLIKKEIGGIITEYVPRDKLHEALGRLGKLGIPESLGQ